MELAGDVEELTVHAGCVAGRSYRSNHGNGELNSTGDADVDYWPGINGNSTFTVANSTYGGTGVTGYGGMNLKGGDFAQVSSFLKLSYRSLVLIALTSRTNQNGGRIVRTAP